MFLSSAVWGMVVWKIVLVLFILELNTNDSISEILKEFDHTFLSKKESKNKIVFWILFEKKSFNRFRVVLGFMVLIFLGKQIILIKVPHNEYFI